LNHTSKDSSETRKHQHRERAQKRKKTSTLFYSLFFAIIVINLARSFFRSVLLFFFDFEIMETMADHHREMMFFIGRFCFLLFNSLQNVMILAAIVVI